MILHVSPEAPLVLRAGAAVLLASHIGGASAALAAGSISLAARKGGRLHRLSGDVFFASMLVMSSIGAVVAPFLPDIGSSLGGVFAFYMTLTAWSVVRRPPGQVGRLEWGGMFMALAALVGCLAIGWIGQHSPGGLINGAAPFEIGYVFAGLAAFAAALDYRVIRQGGLAGPARVRRHLWRMCLALAMAWGSFAGQPKAQPAFLHGSPVLALPALIVLAAMAYWLIRLRSRRRARPQPPRGAEPALAAG
ncbi:MAG TPA: hypothetical protein VHV27_07340 [Phenylobacterium sp.]|jgi:uncharacterized membrane protein|nr:hypothetical protein [Phenylobacterium sp.]